MRHCSAARLAILARQAALYLSTSRKRGGAPRFASELAKRGGGSAERRSVRALPHRGRAVASGTRERFCEKRSRPVGHRALASRRSTAAFANPSGRLRAREVTLGRGRSAEGESS